jgi:hypothetical protein
MHAEKLSKMVIIVLLGMVLFFNSTALAGRWVFTGAGWKWFEYCSVSPTDDSYVNSLDPLMNYGGVLDLHVGSPSGSPAQITRTYVKFDLSVIPPDSTIAAARLNMRSSSIGENPKIEVEAYRVDDPGWNESSINFVNAPPASPPVSDTQTVGSSNKWYSWNVTEDAQFMKAMGLPLSIVLQAPVEGEGYQYCSMSSKEEPYTEFQPCLEIWYEPEGYVVQGGTESYDTISARLEFGPGSLPSIDSDFFGPGSDPFDGIIALDEPDIPPIPPDSFFDVSMKRSEGGFLPEPGLSDTVDTQIIELNLVSTAPITVTGPGPNFPAEYDVTVSLADPGTGQTMITGTGDDTGGTFQYLLSPHLAVHFTPINPALDEKEILIPGPDYPLPIEIIQELPYEWTNAAFEEDPPGGFDDFYPVSGGGMIHNSFWYDGNPVGILDLLPPQEVRTSFMLNSLEEWMEAYNQGFIEPVTPDEWTDYIDGWYDPCYISEGNDYPSDTEFISPQLYVWEPNEPDPCYPEDAGLVMSWGDPAAYTEGEDYASAWNYNYPLDPDISKSVITVTVTPPSASNINAVSFSMTDQAGLMRSWWWSVPSVIPYDVATTVTIDASKTGINATIPQATGYNSARGFNNRAVQSFAADENGTWFPSQAVPAPGKSLATLWNYWYNLSVTPKTPSAQVTSKYYVKWSQRPDVIDSNDPKQIRGWDEPSNYYWKPIVADDWKCTDERPVTDIHWWGSFLGWSQPYPPAVVPRAFHIGIWTDIPLGADPYYPTFSHPGYLIWEHYCDKWVWNFFGYDVQPVGAEEDPNFYDKEACFQFNQLLSEDDWFYQEPNDIWDDDPNSSIYWLSISAVYDPNDFVQHPWGWKTRQPHWNDDAVVIYDVNIPPVDFPAGFPPPSNWPPSIGAAWKAGYPIEYPTGTSWDMSFELTTNEPGPDEISADLNFDGIVNFTDLAIFANQWLDTNP